MVITRIREIKRNRHEISLNDEPAFCLTTEQLKTLGFKEGTEISEEELEAVRSRVVMKNACMRAMDILKISDKTREQLLGKLLLDGYDEEAAHYALSYVEQYGYVDDLRYARQYISSKAQSKSRAFIRAELGRRGVSSDIIAQAFEEEGDIDERAQILCWMEKKKIDPETSGKDEITKFIQFLLRKGFSFSEIKKTLT